MAQRTLVIGGTGFLGTAVVQELLDDGWAVTSLGRGNQPNRVAGARFVVADRSQRGVLVSLADAECFDLVVDCAAYQRPDAEDAVDAFAGRIGHYVFVSTDFVYAPDITGPFPIAEGATKEQVLRYGVGKLDCEAVLIGAWGKRRFAFTSLRPPHILGAGKPLGTGSVQGRDPNLLAHMRDGRELTLIAEGSLLIQPVWNREVGRCVAHIAGDDSAFGQVFNCAGPECVTTRRYYEIVAECLGVPLVADSVGLHEYLTTWPDKAPFARHRIYDRAHLERTTGYRMHLPLRDAIAETVAWMISEEGTAHS